MITNAVRHLECWAVCFLPLLAVVCRHVCVLRLRGWLVSAHQEGVHVRVHLLGGPLRQHRWDPRVYRKINKRLLARGHGVVVLQAEAGIMRGRPSLTLRLAARNQLEQINQVARFAASQHRACLSLAAHGT